LDDKTNTGVRYSSFEVPGRIKEGKAEYREKEVEKGTKGRDPPSQKCARSKKGGPASGDGCGGEEPEGKGKTTRNNRDS